MRIKWSFNEYFSSHSSLITAFFEVCNFFLEFKCIAHWEKQRNGGDGDERKSIWNFREPANLWSISHPNKLSIEDSRSDLRLSEEWDILNLTSAMRIKVKWWSKFRTRKLKWNLKVPEREGIYINLCIYELKKILSVEEDLCIGEWTRIQVWQFVDLKVHECENG